VPKDADCERFECRGPTEAVEFEAIAGAMVRINYYQQQVSGWVAPDKRPPHR